MRRGETGRQSERDGTCSVGRSVAVGGRASSCGSNANANADADADAKRQEEKITTTLTCKGQVSGANFLSDERTIELSASSLSFSLRPPSCVPLCLACPAPSRNCPVAVVCAA